jgi:hypothetical protein
LARPGCSHDVAKDAAGTHDRNIVFDAIDLAAQSRQSVDCEYRMGLGPAFMNERNPKIRGHVSVNARSLGVSKCRNPLRCSSE